MTIIYFMILGSDGNFVLETVVVDGKNKYGPITFSTELGKPVWNIFNVGLNMFPLIKKTITPGILKVSCSDSRAVYYVIKKLPAHGELLLNGVSENFINFTHSDIDNFKVYYQLTNFFINSSLEDSFVFDLYSDFVESLSENVRNIYF